MCELSDEDGIKWEKKDEFGDFHLMGADETFDAYNVYRVTLNLKANSGFYFYDDGDPSCFKINNDVETEFTCYNNGANLRVKLVMAAAKRLIAAVNIQITPPIAGDLPDYAPELPTGAHYARDTSVNDHIYINGLAWALWEGDSPLNNNTGYVFQSGVQYFIMQRLVPEYGYCFSDATLVKVNGETATLLKGGNYENAINVQYAFPAAEERLSTPVLTGTVNGETGVPTVSWNAVPGASYYKVYRKTGSGSYSLKTSGGTTATTYQDSAATLGKTYTYKVIAVSPKGKYYDSLYSNTVTLKSQKSISSVSINITAPKPGELPDYAPVLPSGANYSCDTSINDHIYINGLAWALWEGDSPLDNNVGYVFDYGVEYFIHQTLVAADGYCFADVVTATVNGNSATVFGSGVNQGKKVSIQYAFPATKNRLAAPVLSGTVNGETGATTVSWNAVPGASSYKVYRKTGSGSYSLKTSSGITATTYQDTAVTLGKTYTYKVIAVSAEGKLYNSEYSAELSLKSLKSISKVALQITPPKAGELPDYDPVFPDDAHYHYEKRNNTYFKNGLAWFYTVGDSPIDCNNGYVFWAGQEYSIYLTLEPDAGYRFADSVTGTVNGKAATVFTSALPTDGRISVQYHFDLISSKLPAPVLTAEADPISGRPVISWNAVPLAEKYYVYRKAGSNNWALQTPDGITETTYQSSKATVGVIYKYRVVACSSTKAWSSDYSASVTMPCTLPKPEVSLSKNTAGDPVISWKALTGAASYQIWRKIGSGEWKSLKTGVTGTSYADSGLTVGTKYSYRITAVAAGGSDFDSVVSNTVSVTYTEPTLPAPVLSIAVDEETGRPIITWDPVKGASKYMVYRKAGNNSWALQTSSGTTKTSYQSSKATVGVTYKYRVVAVSPKGKAFNSPYSESVEMTCVAARPVVSIARDKVSGCPVLTWKAVSGANCYKIYRQAGDGDFSIVETVTETEFADSGLSVGTKYSYKVVASIATTGTFDSAPSKVVSEVCTLGAPVIVLGEDPVTGKPKISWEAVPGASKYYVYRKAGSNSWALQTTGGTTATSWVNSKVNDGSTYQYRVVAVCPIDKAFNSGYSNIVSLTYHK